MKLDILDVENTTRAVVTVGAVVYPIEAMVNTTGAVINAEGAIVNTTDPDDGRFVFTTVERAAVLTPTILIIALIIMGNLLVIIAVSTQRHLRTPQNIYFLSLAIVDLLVGSFVLPINLVNQMNGWRWPYSAGLCKLYVTADISLCSMSIFHLCAIGEDRYRIVTQGAYYINERSILDVFGRILVIMILSIWIASAPILGWDGKWLSDLSSTQDCKILGDVGYAIFSIFGSFYFPLAILTYFYCKIYHVLKSRIRLRRPTNVLQEESSDPNLVDSVKTETLEKPRKSSFQLNEFWAKKRKFSVARERRATKTLGVIMGAFTLCWLPFSVMYLTVPICGEYCRTMSPCVMEFVTWLGYFNSALNPIIYTIYNAEFRQAFVKILHLP